ncbi:TRAPP complex subunit trs33 [Amanita rubescens]|nr:TRAPP complex subunit trs33 [Amanita rubescens]
MLADPPTRYIDAAAFDYFLIEAIDTLRSIRCNDEEDALRVRLEAIGMHVGANFSERLCKDKPLFTETLDAIKFVCKDLWAAFWEKQVDNLRTNHRGVYVLQDNSFKPVARLSSWESREVAIKRAKTYAAIPTGIVRGALARLGYQSTVTAEITSLPQCTFQVKLPKGS